MNVGARVQMLFFSFFAGIEGCTWICHTVPPVYSVQRTHHRVEILECEHILRIILLFDREKGIIEDD